MDHTPYQYNAPPAPLADAKSLDAQDAARTAHQLDLLDELTQTGADLVHRTHAVLAQAVDPGILFDQAERCDRLIASLRRTIALSAWITRQRRLAASRQQQQATQTEQARRTEQKHRLHRTLEVAIAAEAGPRAPDLRYRLTQRLADWDVENDLAHSPIDAAIGRLCREFGLTPPAAEGVETSGPAGMRQTAPARVPALHDPP